MHSEGRQDRNRIKKGSGPFRHLTAPQVHGAVAVAAAVTTTRSDSRCVLNPVSNTDFLLPSLRGWQSDSRKARLVRNGAAFQEMGYSQTRP